jgi:hypothetical protein
MGGLMLVLMVMALAAFLTLAPLSFVVLPFWGWDDTVHSWNAYREGSGTTTKEALLCLPVALGFVVWILAGVLWLVLVGAPPRWKDK